MTNRSDNATPTPPGWLDKAEYPFKNHYFAVDGHHLHYIDEGDGRPVVFVHGNPTWSFMYRHLIKEISDSYRCIALDNIGYGLSDKPKDYPYLPADHAANLAALIDHLGLQDITLVLHDWGGPFGMNYAVDNPQRINSIVLMNTWFWPVEHDSYYRFWSNFMGGPVGRMLSKGFNFQTRFLMRQLSADDSKMSREVHWQYIYPQQYSPREAGWILPREVLGSTEWLRQIWQNIDQVSGIPVLIIWAHRDTAFKLVQLRVLKKTFTNIWNTIEYTRSGHYLPEERGPELVPHMHRFLNAMDAQIPMH